MFTTKKLLILLSIVLTFSASPAFAYDSHFAHRQLAAGSAALWQKINDAKLSEEQFAALVDGAEQEDYPVVRTLNHFYEPSTGRGLTIMGLALGQPSPDWAMGSKWQASGWGGDFSWPTAVAAGKNADEHLAWLALGHNLHLLADLASPAHTHNDDHAEGDNYENYIKHVLRDGLATMPTLTTTNEESNCEQLTACLEGMAAYTSAHAMSKDWSLVRDLPQGTELRDDSFYFDGQLIGKYDPLSEKVVLDSEVFAAYFKALAPRVISYGQAIIGNYLRESGEKIVKNESPELAAPSDLQIEPSAEPKQKPIRITIPNVAIIDIKKPDLVSPALKKIDELINPDIKFDWPIVDESIGIPREYLNSSLWPELIKGVVLPVSAASLDEVAVTKPEDAHNNTPSSTLPIVNDNPITEPEENIPPVGDNAGGGGAPPPLKDEEIVPSVNFYNLPSDYSGDLQIIWKAQPDGLWTYDLSIAYDDQAPQSLVKGQMLNVYQFSPTENHSILKLFLVGRLPDGTRVGTSTEIMHQAS